MSTKPILPPQLGYLLLKIALFVWAATAALSHGYYWFMAATQQAHLPWLIVFYGQEGAQPVSNPFGFLVSSIVVGLLIYAFWCAYQAVRRLEHPERAYDDMIHQLARFATALCLYSSASVVASILQASARHFEKTGEFGLTLIIAFDQINLFIISLVLFLVGKALRLGSQAISETQTFL